MARPDPARDALLRALAEVEGRVDASTNAIVRMIAGGNTWNGERTRQYRASLSVALIDLDVVTRTLAMLDQIDVEVSR